MYYNLKIGLLKINVAHWVRYSSQRYLSESTEQSHNVIFEHQVKSRFLFVTYTIQCIFIEHN